ncbi:hypothetical protein BpHYR1_020487 [Brachionus plicatilis]|uniref:Uncharacterized protein n=1 Tax=Brachionus plicatilis TaxID=10195 RepID=A0A3M7PSC7_BRAPC|nr:hypothetical protein BpHYR1_020487 [Brachionus plicatilis]
MTAGLGTRVLLFQVILNIKLLITPVKVKSRQAYSPDLPKNLVNTFGTIHTKLTMSTYNSVKDVWRVLKKPKADQEILRKILTINQWLFGTMVVSQIPNLDCLIDNATCQNFVAETILKEIKLKIKNSYVNKVRMFVSDEI